MSETSVKAQRMMSALHEPMSKNPCVACIIRFSETGMRGTLDGCMMLANSELRQGYEKDGIQYSKCFVCIRENLKCLELPTTFDAERAYLVDRIKDAIATAPDQTEAFHDGERHIPSRPANSYDKAVWLIRKQYELQTHARYILSDLDQKGMTPHEEKLCAHSGSTEQIQKTGILFGKSGST